LGAVAQAGGIVFRREHGEIAILLVRGKRDPTAWIFPKGHVEPGESEAETALRETREEAGVDGESLGPVGAPLEFPWNNKIYRVQYFLIRPTSESAETDGRAKAWCSFDEALARLTHDDTRRLLREARPRMEGPGRG
jgi:8-oxo-dGTP pyrophosphatase MutT (NUDIX family)